MAGGGEQVGDGLVRYRSFIADSARWAEFEHRPGDIVISTPPKSGTTWTQMLCALLVFDGARFPSSLDEVSPWLDMVTRSTDDVLALLAAQDHRRFIKTHTPLDGLPRWDDVTYIVVGRDPRDVAVSWEHHVGNIDFERLVGVRAAAVGLDDLADLDPPDPPIEDPRERFLRFVDDDRGTVLSLRTLLHHLDTGWQRRHEPNVALFHYSDYQRDLPGELGRLAAALGIELDPARAEALAGEAGLDRMRARAREVVPDSTHDFWKDPAAFFRSGGHGEWEARLRDGDLDHYAERVADLADPELSAWAHLGWSASGLPRD